MEIRMERGEARRTNTVCHREIECSMLFIA
jgi:hypothetical protein